MSDQALIDAAKASIIAYNEKDWDAIKRTTAPGVVYDEVSTSRKMQGIDDVLSVWKGWATAFPDSRATFEAAHVSGDTVILELTWRGNHTGLLKTPTGEIPATGKPMQMRACQIIEVADGKTQRIRQYFDMATLMAQIGTSAASV
jgi:steroid delta-isomerase-like uncharacterized protein